MQLLLLEYEYDNLKYSFWQLHNEKSRNNLASYFPPHQLRQFVSHYILHHKPLVLVMRLVILLSPSLILIVVHEFLSLSYPQALLLLVWSYRNCAHLNHNKLNRSFCYLSKKLIILPLLVRLKFSINVLHL